MTWSFAVSIQTSLTDTLSLEKDWMGGTGRSQAESLRAKQKYAYSKLRNAEYRKAPR